MGHGPPLVSYAAPFGHADVLGTQLSVTSHQTLKRRLPRVQVILEILKALPLRLGKIAASAAELQREHHPRGPQ